ncbi:hypothetical protein C5167_006359 [Papaver somniferum]|uniref:Uncharacterized protein n=1 Tax=Papaver somniferum TaxID=3469 RepID=A0A4Y7JD31_PAPSO|nr:hypothetical protein C5167_006359 [Papaver somniferum]
MSCLWPRKRATIAPGLRLQTRRDQGPPHQVFKQEHFEEYLKENSRKEEKEEKEKLALDYGVALMKFISTQSYSEKQLAGDTLWTYFYLKNLLSLCYCEESQKVYEKFIAQILSDLRRGLRTYSPKTVLARMQKLKSIYFAPAKNGLGWRKFEGSWLTLDR